MSSQPNTMFVFMVFFVQFQKFREIRAWTFSSISSLSSNLVKQVLATINFVFCCCSWQISLIFHRIECLNFHLLSLQFPLEIDGRVYDNVNHFYQLAKTEALCGVTSLLMTECVELDGSSKSTPKDYNTLARNILKINKVSYEIIQL